MEVKLRFSFVSGTGIVASFYAPAAPTKKPVGYAIDSIRFFRHTKDGLEVIANCGNLKAFEGKEVVLDLPKLPTTHRTLSAAKGKVFFLTGAENGNYGVRLYMEADLAQLGEATYAKVAAKRTGNAPILKSGLETFEIRAIYRSELFGIDLNVTLKDYSMEHVALRSEYSELLSKLNDCVTEEDLHSALTAVESKVQEMRRLRDFWNSYSVGDFLQETHKE